MENTIQLFILFQIILCEDYIAWDYWDSLIHSTQEDKNRLQIGRRELINTLKNELEHSFY